MRRRFKALWVVLLVSPEFIRAQDSVDATAELNAAFSDYSGSELVFQASELPPGVYHDLMVPLPTARRAAALKIALQEAKKFPPHFLQDVGVKAIGIFDSCASRQGDGYRRFDKELKGYRYFGIYNGKDAVAAAFYTDEQLPLTFHHEIFHHIDAMTATDRQDRRWTEILEGKNRYPAPDIRAADLMGLKKLSQGRVLTDAVSEYAEKNPAEDKAETARHLMSALADSLVQVVEHPELAGSQRILHVLDRYHRALNGKGPTVEWFVNVALGRPGNAADRLVAERQKPDVRTLAMQLQSFASGEQRISVEQARSLLRDAEKLAATKPDAETSGTLANASAAATQQLLKAQIRPSDGDRQFVVLGEEDRHGVNWTLRRNVTGFGEDAARLADIEAALPGTSDLILRTQLQNLRLLSRFYVFIAARWQVTEKTRQIFEGTRNEFASALVESQPQMAATLMRIKLERVAEIISSQGAVSTVENSYLKNIDAEISDLELRRVIRGVQPACVRLGGGSGVNVSARGHILTAAHVAGRVNERLTAEFPDGRRYVARCVAFDKDLDLAICRISTDDWLPFAFVSHAPPITGTSVVCIGQPGTLTPDGKPTGYQPFHVSTGTIRGFLKNPLGPQQLGRTKHDAWTYWGHSGSPLFDERGQIVAMHNSWDSSTAMRHAITQQAIAQFLMDQRLEESIAPKE